MKQRFLLFVMAGMIAWAVTGCQGGSAPKDAFDMDHPRIMLLKGEEAVIQKAVSASPVWGKMHQAILDESDKIIELPPVERIQIGRRLLDKSREALRRIFHLSYAYRMTGDEKYFQRAEKEMLYIANFSDWNPSHFLDVAEMTMAMAIGYDWLYDKLPAESRAAITEAILKKGLEPSFDSTYNWFLTAEHNWNQVCNAGMTYGALAILDDHPDIAREVIDRAFESIHLPMEDYEPDGAYPEGYGYWGYGTTFNVMFQSAVDKVFPGRFDYSKHPGFLKTGTFLQFMTGTTGRAYNWGDAGGGGGLNPAMFWFASKNNDPSLLWVEKSYLDREDYSRFTRDRLLPAIMVWGKDIPFDQIKEPALDMYVGHGKMPLALTRTSWTDPDGIYLGFKAGSPSVNHGHMDVGSFIMESEGVRWAIDLGSQSYESLESRGMSIFGRDQDAQRWTILRLNNYLHNTLTVNMELQRVTGYADMDRYSAAQPFQFAITDMSTVYEGLLASAVRGAGVVDKKFVVVRDELAAGSNPAKVRWQMVTGTQVTKISGNTATLEKDGKTLTVRVDEPAGVILKTWSTEPTTDYDAPNPDTILLGFEADIPAGQKKELQVLLIPGNAGEVSFPAGQKLDDWK